MLDLGNLCSLGKAWVSMVAVTGGIPEDVRTMIATSVSSFTFVCVGWAKVASKCPVGGVTMGWRRLGGIAMNLRYELNGLSLGAGGFERALRR